MNHLNGNNRHSQASNYGRSVYDDQSTAAKLEHQLRETEQLLEISILKKKLRETERAMEQIIADIHGKAAKCNENPTMDVTATQVRDIIQFSLNTHKYTHTHKNQIKHTMQCNPNHTSHQKNLLNRKPNRLFQFYFRID